MDKPYSMMCHVMKGIKCMSVVLAVIAATSISWSVSADEVTQQFNGVTLNGKLEIADGKAFADGIILITHSLIQHNEREPIPYIQQLLKENGYSSLAINYSLAINNRHGPFDCMAQHRYTLDQSLEEIRAWIKWLNEKGVNKLILFGHSYGGNEIARYAANNDEEAILGIVLLGPGTADHRGWSPRGYKIRYGKELSDLLERAELLVASGKGDAIMENVDFLFCPQTNVSAKTFVSYYRVDPERLLPNLMKEAKKPTLFIAASEDNRMPDLNRLVKPFVDGERTRLVIIEGAGHFFLDLYSDDAVEQSIGFFQQINH